VVPEVDAIVESHKKGVGIPTATVSNGLRDAYKRPMFLQFSNDSRSVSFT
jgi:hypothetical protein